MAGYAVSHITGHWSREGVGAILAQCRDPGSPQAAVRLVASMGPREQAGAVVTLPGVATCDLGPNPAEEDCRGGPVIL